jgi:hypothetical protein
VQIATSPITLIILAVAALSAALIYLAYNFDSVKAIAVNAIRGLVNLVIPYINTLIGRFNAIAGLLGVDKMLVEPFEKMESVAVPAFKSLGQVVTEIKDDLGLLKEETEETKESLGTLPPVIEEITQSTSSATSGIKRMAEAFMELPRKATPALMELKPAMVAMKQQMVDFGALAIQAGRAVSDVFAQSLRDAFGELEEGETRFGKFKESMIRMLRDMIIQFTAAAVAAFALAVAVRLSFGVAGLGGIGDIFSTMQSVGGFMPNIPMLAEGGVVTSPTLAMIGEGGQSEAVIPLDRLNEFGGGQNVVVTGRISGADILLSNERASRNRTRQRGF